MGSTAEFLERALNGPVADQIRWAIALVRTNLTLLLACAALAGVAWLIEGRDLAGTRRWQWRAAPGLLLLALLCLVGPGRLFPKTPWEGPILLEFSRQHALTLLDLPGLACIAAAVALGAHALAWRRRQRSRRA